MGDLFLVRTGWGGVVLCGLSSVLYSVASRLSFPSLRRRLGILTASCSPFFFYTKRGVYHPGLEGSGVLYV